VYADLVIRGGTYVLGDGVQQEGVGIAVQGDRVVAICRHDELPDARRVIDATGRVVVPGLIDTHVHTRAPGYEYKEDFERCSAAAAAGGITTIFAMFSVIPPIVSAEACRHLVAYGQAHSLVNFCIYGLITSTNGAELPKMVAEGVVSLKVLMGYKYEPNMQAVTCPSDGLLLDAMRVTAESNVPVCAHAENDEILQHRRQALVAAGRRDPMCHLEARPSIAEAEAISRLVVFTRHVGGRLHILHLSGRQGLDTVCRARGDGVRVTAETCPHYLLLTNDEHVARYGTVAKCNPPIRHLTDQNALWEGVRFGGIDVIGTDHAPHTDAEKMAEHPFDDMWAASPGFAGVETSIPLLLTEVNKGRLSLARFVECCSTSAARIFGLYPDRGVLRPGGAADITVLDLHREWTIDRRTLHSKNTISPFDGWTVRGKPTQTIVNGTVAYEDGEVLGRPGDGRFVRASH